MTYKEKIVWITGASSGIGEALSYQFAKENAILVLSSRNKTELERVRKSCLEHCDECILLPLDLTDHTNFKALAKSVIDKYKRIDILINNGGISQRSLISETDIEIDKKVFEINFFGTVALTKAVLPYMLNQKDGHVAVVSSIVGKFGFPERSAYSSSKHALHGFIETLHAENGKDGIKTLAIIPGRINTNISLNAITASGESHNKMDHSLSNGLTAEYAAIKIIRALKKNKKEVLIGKIDLLMVYIRRFLPFIYYRIVSKVKPR